MTISVWVLFIFYFFYWAYTGWEMGVTGDGFFWPRCVFGSYWFAGSASWQGFRSFHLVPYGWGFSGNVSYAFLSFFLERFLSLANHGEAPRTDNADAGEKSRFAKITPKKKKKQHKNNENTHRYNTKASLFFILAIATFITSVISRQSLLS